MDNLLSYPTEHLHGPTPDVIPVIQLKNQIKTRAATTDEQSSVILTYIPFYEHFPYMQLVNCHELKR